jgi:hypothetical protein
MKLHELSPQEGSVKNRFLRAEAQVPATERPLVRVIRVRRLVPVLRELVSKVVRCLYTEDFLREASTTETQRIS